MNITVYLGAHEGNDPSYRKAVEELGAWIAGNGNRLVYGGSDEGLMAVIADTVLAHGGEVTGIEAQMFADQGVAHQGLTELVIVPDITESRTHDRTGRRVHRLPRRHGHIGGSQRSGVEDLPESAVPTVHLL